MLNSVIVVDDEASIRNAVEQWLSLSGFDVQLFTCAEDCLGQLPAHFAGVIVSDVRMPGMGGLHVQEALRQRGLNLPVIFVSGHADVPIVVRAFKAGAVDFIEKPYNEQLLLDSVQQALASRARPAGGGDARLAEVQVRLDSLTPRERDVLLPLVRGYTNREVAEQLQISVKTVDLYRSRVMKRMQAESLPELVGMAIAAGLLDPLAVRD